MEKYSGEERRKFPRLEANFIVSYRAKRARNDYDLSQTKNVSGGGALITTNKPFEEGTTLVITIRFPFLSQRVELTGKVVESEEVVKNLIYDTRVAFQDTDAKFVDELKQVVEKRLGEHG